MSLGIEDFISLSSDELVSRGVAQRDVTRERQAMTGHRRPFSAKWIRAIGGWGGVLTLEEIAMRVGIDVRSRQNGFAPSAAGAAC